VSAHRLDDRIGPDGESREWLILASIRAGGYVHVAARAYGVRSERVLRWLRRGRGPLANKLLEAAARARLKAEMAVYEADPRFWLRHGPGKETRDTPGWTALAKPSFEQGYDGAAELLASGELQEILGKLLDGLTPFPDARAAVAGTIEDARKR
jgi:hypothetical protein